MKKIYLILILCITLGGRTAAQNAFYDAQALAAITPLEKALLESPYDKRQFSDEENQMIKAVADFLDDPANAVIDPKLINPALLKKILVKIAYIDPNNASANLQTAYSNASGFLGIPGSSSPTLSGLGNDISRLGSADYQTMLIDATAKYLAESFKQDVTYHYFRLLKDKIDSIPMIKGLFPQTCAVIEKIDPFNFKNLGDSWKAAFEKDLQNLPLAVPAFIKANQGIDWCKKVYKSDYFQYYSYSVDILDPLIKGAHPVEILQTLDKNYYPLPMTGDFHHYRSFIHLLNILQFNLQDSTKKATGQQFQNVWISFNQLKQLNTPKKIQFFCRLLYLQDPVFFTTNVLGKKIGTILNSAAGPNRVIESLSNLLVVLNQVEGGFQQIKTLKSANASPATIAGAYVKQVLSIADSTNSFLKKIGAGSSVTGEVDKCLQYGDDAYQIYNDVVQKNYAGAIQQAVTLLQTIDTKGRVNVQVFTAVLTAGNYATDYAALYTAYNTVKTDLGAKALDNAHFYELLLQNIKFNTIDAGGAVIAIQAAAGYNGQSKQIKADIDKFSEDLKTQITALNKKLLKDKDIAKNATYQKVLLWINTYGNVIAGVATAQNSDDLEKVIKNFVESSGSYVYQRTSRNTISIAAKVGIAGGFEGTDHFTSFKPNFGLSVPIGFEFSRGGRIDKQTPYPFLNGKNKVRYLDETSSSWFVQIFDIFAVVNYRLGADSSSTLPQKILLQQVFSPGITYNIGFKNVPFDLGVGGEYTPQLRKIGDQLQASTIRLFIRLSWDKPLIFLHRSQ